MPLRQTMLGFKATSQLPTPSVEMPPLLDKMPDLSRTSSGISSQAGVDADTIVVDLSEPRAPLPTPSESATDISSQSSQIISLKEVSKGRGKRVSTRGIKSQQSHDCLLDGSEPEYAQSRSVSGETLVMSTSQSSLVHSGIAGLNLPWSMSSVFGNGSKGELLARNEKSMSTTSFESINGEEEQARLEKLAAKRAKMEENAKLREARWKAEDEKSTRRSARASMLGKAGDLVSGLAASVLGKRSRDASDKGLDKVKNTLRPKSMVEPLSASTLAFEGSVSKRRRLSDGDLPLDEPSGGQARKSITKRKEKRWLNSGLYAGQSRTFDARLSESKNKSIKQDKTSGPVGENSVLPLPMFAGERLLKQGRDFQLPFDVFSPLPAGQPKPDEWRKVNKNVFIGDAAQEWRDVRFEEHSTCMCRPETGCDSDCMNRFMYYECDSRNCRLTEEQCGNRSFEGLRQRAKKGGKYNVGVEVIKTADRGYGVRSNRTFEPNQIIVEYTGEIITQEECESRMRTIYKDNECYYLMLFDQNMIIDATRGSIARFVNHSCEPNCRMEKWTVGGKPRMALFAGDRGIMTGEELTYDYNFDPYSQKNVQECRCGAQNCRGVLGPKTKEEKKPKAVEDKGRTESRLAGAKRKIASAIGGTLGTKKKAAAKLYGSPKKSPVKVSKGTVTKIRKKRMVSASASSNRVTSLSAAAISRRPSKLKRMINNAKDKSTSKRVVSTASASSSRELITNDNTITVSTQTKSLSRSASVKAKAATIRKSVVRTVRGARSGKGRSIRAVAAEDDESA